jgi:hypothetical protein
MFGRSARAFEFGSFTCLLCMLYVTDGGSIIWLTFPCITRLPCRAVVSVPIHPRGHTGTLTATHERPPTRVCGPLRGDKRYLLSFVVKRWKLSEPNEFWESEENVYTYSNMLISKAV